MVYWQAEQKIRNGLVNLLNNRTEKRLNRYSSVLPELEDKKNFTLDFSLDCFKRISNDDLQRLAAEKIFSSEVVVISGRGGTGKTEVVTTVLSFYDQCLETEEPDEEAQSKMEAFIQENDSFHVENLKSTEITDEERKEKDKETKKSTSNGRILYVAPTGKAAAVMRKRAKKDAFTIHQVLFSYRSWRLKKSGEDQSGGGTSVGEWKFAETRVCAVDECSMVSVVLFSSLIECLQKASCLTKIVLLGDVLQLPSIDPGNFMEDLFNAFRPEGLAIELETNHRSEGSLIFENARR